MFDSNRSCSTFFLAYRSQKSELENINEIGVMGVNKGKYVHLAIFQKKIYINSYELPSYRPIEPRLFHFGLLSPTFVQNDFLHYFFTFKLFFRTRDLLLYFKWIAKKDRDRFFNIKSSKRYLTPLILSLPKQKRYQIILSSSRETQIERSWCNQGGSDIVTPDNGHAIMH